MTIRDLLAASGVSPLDAEVLLAHLLQKPRSWLLAHEDEECSDRTEDDFDLLTLRRKEHEPVALIIGMQEFYGRPFSVTRDTLIPRPATEYLLEETLRLLEEKNGGTCIADTDISILSMLLRSQEPDLIVDVGTGSGCIAITLAKEGYGKPIIGVDIVKNALSIARKNASAHDVSNVTFREADGSRFVREVQQPFLLVSNPPYIPEGTILEKNVMQFEPHRALFAGKKGLDIIIPLVKAAVENEHCMGLVLELRTDQLDEVRSLISSGMLQA